MEASGTIVLTEDEVHAILRREEKLQKSGLLEQLDQQKGIYNKIAKNLYHAQQKVYDLEAELEQAEKYYLELQDQIQKESSS